MFDIEPLPLDHPFRKLDNVVLTPHLGYVAAQNYRAFFAGMVDDIRAFLDGKPVRVLTLVRRRQPWRILSTRIVAVIANVTMLEPISGPSTMASP